MNRTTSNDYYSTSDLGVSVYLYTLGYPIAKTELAGPQRLIFFFEKNPKIPHDVIGYLNGQGKAPARQLFENYRALRALTFTKTGNSR